MRSLPMLAASMFASPMLAAPMLAALPLACFALSTAEAQGQNPQILGFQARIALLRREPVRQRLLIVMLQPRPCERLREVDLVLSLSSVLKPKLASCLPHSRPISIYDISRTLRQVVATFDDIPAYNHHVSGTCEPSGVVPCLIPNRTPTIHRD